MEVAVMLGLMLILFVGVIWLDRVGWLPMSMNSRTRLLQSARRAWQQTGGNVHFGPVEARYYGTLNADSTWDASQPGVLGLGDDRLFFWNATATLKLDIPYAVMRWCSLIQQPGDPLGRTVTLHCVVDDRRVIHAFDLEFDEFLAQALTKYGDVPYDANLDYGPLDATLHVRDLYGKWGEARACSLFLAPDRLVMDIENAIPFGQMRMVELVRSPANILVTGTLLRLDYALYSGALCTICFDLPPHLARQLGDILAKRAGLALTESAQPKKKG